MIYYAAWLFKRAPFIASIFFLRILPVWNYVLSSLQALYWIRYRRRAKAQLDELYELIDSIDDVTTWYSATGFIWSPDPLGGALDFSQRPWVSVAKRSGDCDDMMTLSYYLLKNKCGSVIRCYTYCKDGTGHALLLVKDVDTAGVVVLSNQYKRGPYPNVDEAVRDYYGSKTKYYFIF